VYRNNPDRVDDHTLDVDSADNSHPAPPPAQPHLVVALECARPTALSARHRLGQGGTVTLGRGPERAVQRSSDHRGSDLRLSIPDRRMSSRHARLDGALGTWAIRDLGSRNGVFVNGVRVSDAPLRHGDVLQLGHTLLLYRVGRTHENRDDLDAASGSAVAGLTTLDPDLAETFGKLARLVRAGVSILVQGETGTGKDVTAHAIHLLAGVKGRFVGINCGGIPAALLEAELFGSTRGAYSGAVSDRMGLIREADGGTLFLDEIGDLPVTSQAAFLRVLQERRVRPIGGAHSYPVDLRVVSATNQDLAHQVREGRFRNDLFARIAGFRLTLPPLRERREDLGLLIGRLLEQRLGSDAGRVVFSPEAALQLFTYEFPLNIRELDNWLATATALAGDRPILPEHFPEPVPTARPSASFAAAEPPTTGAPPVPMLTEAQQSHRDEVVALLRKHAGNVSAVARETSKARNQVQRWIKRYQIDPNEFRS
jgi:transcriptional regulator with GAF, ATPase, and Fis domain